MIRSLFLFPAGVDGDAVDAYINNVLVPQVKPQPGVVSIMVSDGPLMGPGGPKPYAKVVEVTHESLDAMIATAQVEGGVALVERFDELGGLLMAYEVDEA